MLNVAGVVLAGGKSSRMGTDKSALMYNGNSLLNTMIAILKAAGIKAIYINNLSHIKDIIPNKGPLSGVHASIYNLQNKHDYLIYVPVDMPGLYSDLILQLIYAPSVHEVVRFADYILPFRLNIQVSELANLEQILFDENNNSLKYFQSQFNIHKLPIAPDIMHCFSNLNTPSDWQQFITLDILFANEF